MKTKYIFIALLIPLFITCASTEAILSEFDDSADFENYSSFVICLDDLYVEHATEPAYDNTKVRQIISDKLIEQMIARDHETNVYEPELQVGFELIIEKKEVEFVKCDVKNEFDYWRECTIDTEIYTEETLVVYISDISKNQVIWQASTPCSMNRSKNKIEYYITTIVEKLFNEYPKAKNKI